MSIRSYKWAVGLLACAALFAGWRAFVLSRERAAVLGISEECEHLERFGLSGEDPGGVALEIQWLQIYYGQNTGRISDPRLQRVARREYEHTMTNSVAALHRIVTNNGSTNMNPWLAGWLKEHEH